jgi:SecD/SecF fusion protein
MSRRAAFFVVGLVAAALVGVALLAIPGSPIQQKPTLGLDLQGGLEVTLQAVPPRDRELTTEDLDRSVQIMRNRVDKLGVAEPEIRTQGNDQISIQLPGVKDPAAAASIIGKTAQLELFDLEANLQPPSINLQTKQPIATPKLYDLLAGQQSLAQKGTPESFYVFRTKGKKLVVGPVQTREAALSKWDGKLPAGHKLLAVPPQTVVVHCGPNDVVCPGVGESPPTRNYFYLLRYTPPAVPEMTGKDLKLSGTRQDFDTQTGEPIVLMDFTGKGQDMFEKITRDIAVRGKLLFNTVGAGQGDYRNYLQHFAIVLDREIKSWPSIDFEQYPGGIGGSNGAQISGLASVGEAKNLALVLQTGALPVEFRTLDQTTVSATLGKDSLQEARTAALVGLVLVAIFLLVFYRFLGVVAVLGLAIYAALLYAAILLFNVTLTLPGFAGLVLTLGVAADANVVIFERIKEEVRAGRSIRAAISTGYTKGFHTIVDANAVTAITALVLFAVATASVRGFALMLLIGTAISMLTAVVATRAMLTVLSGFKWFDNPRFMGATANEIPRWQRIDVVGRRRLWFILSLVAIGVSVVALIVQGLNLGIDFKGGTQARFATPAPVSLSAVRDQMAAIGRADAVVQGRGQGNGDLYREFEVRTESLTEPEQTQLEASLTQRLDAQIEGVRNVSASFSRQILKGAIVAIIVSFALIALYVTLRYRWRFAVPILRTLLNDVLITLGVYALSGREVTASTVAAVLTILGFSIYDTIIVFDRVRENMKLMPRASIATIANVSVWEVLRRSMVTTFITLVPIVALFLFGGATLQDFAFAIMVGILVGAVSTIFIATPLLTVLMERDPEWARRKDRVGDALPAGVESVGGVLASPEPAPESEPESPVPAPPAAPAAAPAAAGVPAIASDAAKRERRRQRRSGRPHGRAR